MDFDIAHIAAGTDSVGVVHRGLKPGQYGRTRHSADHRSRNYSGGPHIRYFLEENPLSFRVNRMAGFVFTHEQFVSCFRSFSESGKN